MTGDSRHLAEVATDLILAHIKSSIASALSDIRADRNSTQNLGIATSPPNEYFFSKNNNALHPPSVFVVCEDVDFKKERGANFISAVGHYGIAAITEGQTSDIVTRASWRYQAALSKVLDNVRLTAADNAFRIVVIVRNAEFTEEYDPGTKEGDPAKRWRKGVLLKCDVEFYEAL